MRAPSDHIFSLTTLTRLELEALGDFVDRAPSGDIVVCGTRDGGDALFMAEGNDRGIVIIDSFEGLPAPTEKDRGTMLSQGECVSKPGTFEMLNRELGQRVEIYPMFITPETLRSVTHRSVAVLWMDLDFYEPTKACLDYFMLDLVDGGFILCHDWWNAGTPGINKALEESGLTWEMYHTADAHADYLAWTRVKA